MKMVNMPSCKQTNIYVHEIEINKSKSKCICIRFSINVELGFQLSRDTNLVSLDFI